MLRSTIARSFRAKAPAPYRPRLFYSTLQHSSFSRLSPWSNQFAGSKGTQIFLQSSVYTLLLVGAYVVYTSRSPVCQILLVYYIPIPK